MAKNDEPKVELTDQEKELWDKVSPMINTTVNSAVANLQKQLTKAMGETTTSATKALDEKLAAQLEELKNSLAGGTPPNPKPGEGGEGGGKEKDPEVLAKQRALENELTQLKRRTEGLEAERKRLESEKRDSDFRSAVTSMLNGQKVNSTELAFHAIKHVLKYTDDNKILIMRGDEELSLNDETLKDWLEQEAPMFLPSTVTGGAGVRNNGDGRNVSNLTLEKVSGYDKLSKEEQTKMRDKLVQVAQGLRA